MKEMKYLDTTVGLLVTSYENNKSLALMLLDIENEEIYGNITVNIGEVQENCAYVDTNNMPEIEEFLVENEIGYFSGLTGRSGFCNYPLYFFNQDKLKELCPKGYEEYVSWQAD